MTKRHPNWHFYVLMAAGIYNLVWGAVAVLFPLETFRFFQMPPPAYPEFWQCIGMIVGVYGFGYMVAASDSARHWPIVMVGFLGKIFGPMGFAQALYTGALPLAFGINIIFNDVIWWIPFFLILKHAYDVASTQDHETAFDATLDN